VPFQKDNVQMASVRIQYRRRSAVDFYPQITLHRWNVLGHLPIAEICHLSGFPILGRVRETSSPRNRTRPCFQDIQNTRYMLPISRSPYLQSRSCSKLYSRLHQARVTPENSLITHNDTSCTYLLRRCLDSLWHYSLVGIPGAVL